MYDSKYTRLKEWLLPWAKSNYHEKWVLKDINLEVHAGEAVGIIGLNGAGKSTLLKIITGTTVPTSGEVAFHGSVAALLELGLGFHPDFTGRQNVYMSGQLLGYKIEEIDNATGKVLFQQEIDTIPNIVHDVDSWEKENLKEAIIITDKKQMIELLDLNSNFYELASETLKEDEELALKAVEGDGWNYDSLIEKFKNSRKFQLAAVTENSALLHSLPKEVLNDYSFILEACKKNYHCLMYKELWGEEIQRRIEKDLGLDKVKKTYKDEELPF